MDMNKVLKAIQTGVIAADFLANTKRVVQAILVWNECLILLNYKALEKENNFVRDVSIFLYNKLFYGYAAISNLSRAIECGKKVLPLLHNCDRKEEEGKLAFVLAKLYYRQSKPKEAQAFFERALYVKKEIGNKEEEATCYGNLGTVCISAGEYAKAEEYLHKALAISKQINYKHGEASSYGNLGTVFQSVGEYAKAEEYLHKALAIRKETGDKKGEAADYANLGTVFQSVGEYAKAEEYLHKALAISQEINDKDGEATCYENLGTVFHSFGEYSKAEEYLHKTLALRKEIGDKHGEASCYGHLGAVFESLSEYSKAKEYLHKALAITKEIDDKHGEALCYGNLGTVFKFFGEYAKAEEYLHKALAINQEIGSKDGEASCYGNLGCVFQAVCEYAKAEEYLHKALAIRKEIGDKDGEGSCYGTLGAVFQSVGEYAKAEEYLHKALAISQEIGVKEGEALCYENLGAVFESFGEYVKAEEHLHKGLAIRKEIGNKDGEGSCYGNLGAVFQSAGEYAKAEEFLQKAVQISKETGNIELQFASHLNLHHCSFILTGNTSEALSNLLASIQKCEKMLNFLGNKDQYKILFFHRHASPYRLCSVLCCASGKPNEALHVVELGRARALADLMSDRYSVEKEISLNPQSFVSIEKVIEENCNNTCLYISYVGEDIFLWILKQTKPIIFRQTKLSETYSSKHGKSSVDDVFGSESLRKFNVLPQEQCEDRSLFSSFESQLRGKSSPADGLPSLRLVEDEEEESKNPGPPTLSQVYNMLIAPVSDLMEGPEIIVVPDRCLYQVPFAALRDENDRYLSDTFRIRIAPSLTTLKLIQDSPTDYHSKTGALLVGEPSVTKVYYKEEVRNLCPLPGAKGEAEMIARLLPGSQLLIGEQATKQAVLQKIHSVSLIHFAAHGDAERGEIALAPPSSTKGIPSEPDYLLSMAEISQVRLTAKLVVLSCCHTARGQIKAEGVVGIARAFLGSGARSVLVSLWALQDKATEQFMSRFYESLVQRESASESLHRAMKWMKNNGFSEVRQWAPFMLIGDDVSFDFGK